MTCLHESSIGVTSHLHCSLHEVPTDSLCFLLLTGMPVCSCSDAATEADTNPDAGEEAAAAAAAAAAAHSKPQRQPPAQPAYPCRKSPGQLGSYKAASSSSNDQAAARQPSKRWGVAVPKDVLPYPKPQPAFPFVAVAVEPSAPLMPEEYPCA
jgi:hypothetical protein